MPAFTTFTATRLRTVLNSVDARRWTVTCLRTELSHSVCNKSSSQGKYADCRSGPRLQKIEQISHPKAFAFEIGRVGRSCFEKGAINAVITQGFGEHAAAIEDVAGVLSKNERLTLLRLLKKLGKHAAETRK